MDIPRPLRHLVGRKRLVQSLRTTDIAVARIRRHKAIMGSPGKAI